MVVIPRRREVNSRLSQEREPAERGTGPTATDGDQRPRERADSARETVVRTVFTERYPGHNTREAEARRVNRYVLRDRTPVAEENGVGAVLPQSIAFAYRFRLALPSDHASGVTDATQPREFETAATCRRPVGTFDSVRVSACDVPESALAAGAGSHCARPERTAARATSRVLQTGAMPGDSPPPARTATNVEQGGRVRRSDTRDYSLLSRTFDSSVATYGSGIWWASLVRAVCAASSFVTVYAQVPDYVRTVIVSTDTRRVRFRTPDIERE